MDCACERNGGWGTLGPGSPAHLVEIVSGAMPKRLEESSCVVALSEGVGTITNAGREAKIGAVAILGTSSLKKGKTALGAVCHDIISRP